MIDIDERWLLDNGLFDIADPTHLYDQIVTRRERGDDGIQPPWSKLSGLYSIPLRGVTVVGAYSGTGKSTLVSQWGVHAADNGHKVAIMSLEMPADFTLELMAEQASVVEEPHLPYVERFAKWADDRIYLHSATDVVTPEKVFQFVEVAKTMLGCDLIIVDPLMQVGLPSDIDAEKEFITKLSAMSRDYECAIVLVHHLRKPPGGGQGEKQRPTKSDFLGSTHITGAAASVLTLWADPDKREARSNGWEVDDDHPDYVLTLHKSRFSSWHGSVGLYQHPKARVLTNSRARQYKAINLEDTWTSRKEQSGELQAETALVGLPVSSAPEISQATDSTTLTDPFLSSSRSA